MKTSLRLQLFILIFVAIFIAVGINSFIFYQNTKKEYLNDIYIKSQNDFDLVQNKMDKYSADIVKLVDKITINENVINGLNLVSNYQDKNDYDKILFDEEKKKLLSILDIHINTSEKFSYGLFDKNGDIVVLNRTFNSDSSRGISTYENGKVKFINLYDNVVSKNLPYLKKIDDDVIEKVNIQLESDGFGIRYAKKIYKDGNLVGYLRLKKKFNQENISLLLRGIKNKFAFLTVDNKLIGTLLNINTKLILKSANSFEREIHSPNEMFKDERYYYHAHYLSIDDDKKLYLIVANSQDVLNNKVEELLTQLTLVVILSILFSFLVALLFLKISIINPLNILLDGISKIKNKRYEKINLNNGSSNELNEIAEEFNHLIDSLEDSFVTVEKAKVFMEDLIDAVPVRIYWKDVNDKYLGANKLFLNDAKVNTINELIGKSEFDMPWAEAKAKEHLRIDLEVMQNNEPKLQIEEQQTLEDGTVITLMISRVPLKNIDGQVIGMIGVYEDITRQKAIEKELNDKDLILMEQSKMAAMGEMLENIAHQWRQPLSVISTSASGVRLNKEMDMLTDDLLFDSLDGIVDSAKHLSQTIDDFRDFFKQDKQKQEFNVKNSFIRAQSLLSSKFKNRSIKVVSELEDINILGNENELVQVFMNILNNAKDALEALPDEERVIFVNIKKDDSNNAIATIWDNAGGIPVEYLEKVFEHKFTTKADQDGTGIGLYMSRLIVEKVDGIIKAENIEFDYNDKQYKGAKFSIILPIDVK